MLGSSEHENIALPPNCKAAITDGVVWFDAMSSRRFRAVLAVRDGRILAVNENSERREAAIKEMEISSRLGNAPRRFVFPDGVAVTVADNDAVDSLIQQIGGRGSFLYHWEKGRWILPLLLLAAALGYFIVGYAVPSLADYAARRTPLEQLDFVSTNVYEGLINQGVLEESALPLPRREHVQTIFAEAAEPFRGEYQYDLRFHQMGTANAFALPSGLIVVSDSLVNKLSDDELLAVLLHEIGHVEERHGMRNLMAAAGSGLFLALLGDVSFVTAGGAALWQLKYSREHETEADCFAARELLRRKKRPVLLSEALHNISAQTPETDGKEYNEDEKIVRAALEALSTHPSHENRSRLEEVCGI